MLSASAPFVLAVGGTPDFCKDKYRLKGPSSSDDTLHSAEEYVSAI